MNKPCLRRPNVHAVLTLVNSILGISRLGKSDGSGPDQDWAELRGGAAQATPWDGRSVSFVFWSSSRLLMVARVIVNLVDF